MHASRGRTGMYALGHERSRKRSEMGLGDPSRSPLSHIPVLRGTYASCYRQRPAERSSYWVTYTAMAV
jgi:hypothetical protein